MIGYAPLCEKQSRYIKRSLSSWLNVAEGGKRAGKNVMNIIAWAASLENHPNKLHLAAGVSISAVKLNILDSDGLGLTHIFQGRCREGTYKDRDALFIKTRTGEKIVLIAGGSDNGSEAKIKGQTYGSVYITEANECCEAFVKECFARTLSSRDRKIFMDLNPKGPQHWFYVDLLNFYDKSSAEGLITGYNYEHFTVLDNLSMSDQQLRDLMLSYDKKSFWFVVDILGLRTAPEGVIYDMWSATENTYDAPPAEGWKSVCTHYVGIDYGTSNATAFLDTWDDGTTYWIDREYYYDGRKERRQKTDEQYADDLDAFLDGNRDAIIVVDPSAASFITVLRNRGYMIKEADNAVRDGLRVVSTLMTKRMIRVRADACPNLIREISGYVWDEKARMRGEEQPVKVDDHACDALRYVIKTTANRWRISA
ncbi:MAG: PBSX family phage terminase large subunit [Bacteroidales bacterium]|nr:PBSX family phage terminase large subunit [Bacteroidales bacterium]